MDFPLVSVIVATYRRNNELERAIISLQAQTYENIEVIIVDDNDKKEWNEIVSKIVERYSISINLIYIQNHPNKGSACSRNIGISNAKGVYITFLDDDDEYLPNKIKEQVDAMSKNKADYSITDLALYDDNGKLVETRNRVFLKSPESELLTCHLKYHLTGTDTFMFKRDYLYKLGGFDEIDIGDEFYLMLKAINKQGAFIYIETCSVKAYVHNSDGGLSTGDKKIDGENILFEYKKKYFPQLKKQDIRYIKMRHYAVLAYASIHKKRYLKTIVYGIRCVLSSPIGFFSLIKERG